MPWTREQAKMAAAVKARKAAEYDRLRAKLATVKAAVEKLHARRLPPGRPHPTHYVAGYNAALDDVIAVLEKEGL